MEYLRRGSSPSGASRTMCSTPRTTSKRRPSSRGGPLRGGVVVATNMAGRGTDIVLGGNVPTFTDQRLRERGLDPVETPGRSTRRPGTRTAHRQRGQQGGRKEVNAPAACTCWAPSAATSRGGSTTSCVVGPARQDPEGVVRFICRWVTSRCAASNGAWRPVGPGWNLLRRRRRSQDVTGHRRFFCTPGRVSRTLRSKTSPVRLR